jgi:CRISPR/Cas system-associated exonuclease Cas4 (RecB family)
MSNLSTFEQCPAKFFYAKNRAIKPLPQKPNKYAELGLNVHKIFESYFIELKKIENFNSDNIHPTLQKAIQINRDIISDIKMYTIHFRNFEKFENKRLTWAETNPAMIPEKKLDKDMYRGVIDIIFRDNDSNKVIVDWKTGKFKKDFYMQGWIYKFITDAKRVMFFHSLNNRLVELTEQNLVEGKEHIDAILAQIENSVGEWQDNIYCSECEYSLQCAKERFGLKMEEI